MTRPIALPVNVAGIPHALKTERRWVCWRYESQQHDGKTGRWTKILCTVFGRHAKSNDASTWTTFSEALAAYQTARFDGIGFCLGQGWAGIDLDHCINGDLVAPDAHNVLRRLDDLQAYQEVSPSGTGYKAIGRSPRIGGQIDFAVTPPVYTTWSSARFFAVTGVTPAYADFGLSPEADLTTLIDNWFPAPADVRSMCLRPSFIREGDVRGTENIEGFTDDQVVARILASRQADKFIKLVRGDLSDYGQDHSRADQALCSILAYWCQGDLDQVDRLFRASRLMRPKWNVASYRRATLAKAVQR